MNWFACFSVMHLWNFVMTHSLNIPGSCAQGFGACCTILVDDCTSSNFQKNLTYIVNPSYPSTYSSSSATCKYTLSKVSLPFLVMEDNVFAQGHLWYLHDPPWLRWWNNFWTCRYQTSHQVFGLWWNHIVVNTFWFGIILIDSHSTWSWSWTTNKK